jgi:hypothetical protein
MSGEAGDSAPPAKSSDAPKRQPREKTCYNCGEVSARCILGCIAAYYYLHCPIRHSNKPTHLLTLFLSHLFTHRLVILLEIARMNVLKVRRGRRSTRPVLNTVVASTAERLDTFLLTAPSQLVTRRVTTVDRRDTLPRTAPTPGKIR